MDLFLDKINDKILNLNGDYDKQQICYTLVFELMVNYEIKFQYIESMIDAKFYYDNLDTLYKCVIYYIIHINEDFENNNIILNIFQQTCFPVTYLKNKSINMKNLLRFGNNIHLSNAIKILDDYENNEYREKIYQQMKYIENGDLNRGYSYFDYNILLWFLNKDIDLHEIYLATLIIFCKDIKIIKKHNLLDKIEINMKFCLNVILNNNILVLEYLYKNNYKVEYDINDLINYRITYEILLLIDKYDNILNIDMIKQKCIKRSNFINELIKHNYEYLYELKDIKFSIDCKYLTLDIINNFNIINIDVYSIDYLELKYDQLLYIKNNKLNISIYISSNILSDIINNNKIKYYKFIDNDKLLCVNNIYTFYKNSIYIKDNNIDHIYNIGDLYSTLYYNDLNESNFDEIKNICFEIISNIKFNNVLDLKHNKNDKRQNLAIKLFEYIGLSKINFVDN